LRLAVALKLYSSRDNVDIIRQAVGVMQV